MMFRSCALAAFALACTAPTRAHAQTPVDSQAVRRAMLDYVEAFYEVRPDRIERSVHPTLFKQGMVSPDGGAYRGPVLMTFEQARELAATWNRENVRANPATAPKEIEVLDLLDATAVGKLTASWGTDYLLLAKLEDRWMIMQVLWQTPVRG